MSTWVVRDERRMPYGGFPDVLTLKRGFKLTQGLANLFEHQLNTDSVFAEAEDVDEDFQRLFNRIEYNRRINRDKLKEEMDNLRDECCTDIIDSADDDLIRLHIVDYERCR